MTLADWLKNANLNFAQFGQRIGRSAQAVRRYAIGERIPERETMACIARETGGAVTANDFYSIDDSPAASASSPAAAGASGSKSRDLTPPVAA